MFPLSDQAGTPTAPTPPLWNPPPISRGKKKPPTPERAAKPANAVNDSQNAPPAMNTVPATAVITAHRRLDGLERRLAGLVGTVMAAHAPEWADARSPREQTTRPRPATTPALMTKGLLGAGWCGRPSGRSR